MRIFINTLNANDRFTMPGSDTMYVCEYRRSEGGLTTVHYRVQGTRERFMFTRPGLTTVDLHV